jgi:hypothetical protein
MRTRTKAEPPGKLVTDFTDEELRAAGVNEDTIALIRRLRKLCPFCGGKHA